MVENFQDSTVIDAEFDLIEEMTSTLNDIEKGLQGGERETILEKLGYMRFLLKDLGDNLSDEYEGLRRRRIITKQTTQ